MSIPLVPDATGRRIFVVGGLGSPSGKQGEMAPGLKGFDGRFHHLDDIWELDLEKNAWRCLLSRGPPGPRTIASGGVFSAARGTSDF